VNIIYKAILEGIELLQGALDSTTSRLTKSTAVESPCSFSLFFFVVCEPEAD
jgi:hypothetical protein